MKKRTVLLAALALSALPLLGQKNLAEEGHQARLRGDLDRAAELLEKAVAANPRDARAHVWLADVYGSQAGNANMFSAMSLAHKAKEQLDAAVAADPTYLDARMGLVEFYMSAPGIAGGDHAAAEAQANEIKKRDALTGHRAWAYIYSKDKKPELARKEYVDAVREQPNSAPAHFWLGMSHYQADKNYKAATDEFETALKLDPTFMMASFQIGHMAALSGSNYTRGEEALRKYLAYTPKENEYPHARAHYWLGMIFEKQGQKSAAMQSYDTSLKLNPTQKDVAEAKKRIE